MLELYDIADGKAEPGPDDPTVVFCMDEFGPAEPATASGQAVGPGRGGQGDPASPRRRRMRATFTRPHGVRHLMAGYDLPTDRLYGHVVNRKDRTAFLAFCRYLRSSIHPRCGIAIVLDNFSPHRQRRTTSGSASRPLRTTSSSPTCRSTSSWLNRIEAQFAALRYFALDGTDHPSHDEQARMIRRYIAWRNRNAHAARYEKSQTRKRCLTRH